MNLRDVFQFKKSFVSRRLASVSGVAVFACLSDYLGPLVSTIMIGHAFGEQGLVVSGVVSPINNILVFICDFLCAGSVFIREKYLSAGDKKHASSCLSMAYAIVFCISLIIGLALLFCGDLLISFYDISDETALLAVNYLKWISPMPICLTSSYMVYEIVFRAYDEKWALTMNIASTATMICAAFAGLKLWGMAGVAIANSLMNVATVIVGLIPIIKDRESYKLSLEYDKESMKEIAGFGIMYSQATLECTLCITLMYAVLGRFFDESSIALYSFFDSASVVYMCCYAVPYAAENHYANYLGDNNTLGVKKTLCASIRIQLIISIVTTVLLFIFAEPIASFIGFEPGNVDDAVRMMHCIALALTPTSFFSLLMDFYTTSDYMAPSFVSFIAFYFIAGAGLQLIVIFMFGMQAFCYTLLVQTSLSLLVNDLYITKVMKKKAPFIMDFETDRAFSYDFDYNEQEIMSVRDTLEQDLISKDVPEDIRFRMMLAFEESCLYVMNRNQKPVYGECTVMLLDDKIKMVLMDSGEVFDATNPEQQVTSLQSYIVANMAIKWNNQKYYNASQTNRITFNFDI